MSAELPVGTYRCTKCGCLWRKLNESMAPWSLLDGKQKPGQCCDNSERFLEVIEPVSPVGEFRPQCGNTTTNVPNRCPCSFPHPPHDYCDGNPDAKPWPL